jgi:TRAP-type C4-dicarboxylate transport system permease large subunit
MIQGLTALDLGRIARCSFPYLMIMVLVVFLLATYPQIVLWLPRSVG